MSHRVWTAFGLSALLVSLGAAGCGSQGPRQTKETQTAGAPPAAPAGGAKGDGQPAGEPGSSPTARRKIIFTGTVDVVVGDLDAARAEVEKLVTKYDGYVARSEARSDAGARRSATYTIRVPVDHFRKLVDGLLALGTAERNATDSQDVTEEYVDVEARVRNLKAEEEALNKLLKESGSRDEVLKTREQIRSIRGDIERAQARLEYLSKLSALSTVNLTLTEIKDYKPPTAPTFGTRVSRTFSGSWESLVDFAEGVALVAVALAPWLPVLIPVGLVGFWGTRRLWRSTNTPTHPRPAHALRVPRANPVTGPAPEATGTGGEGPPPDGGPKPA